MGAINRISIVGANFILAIACVFGAFGIFTLFLITYSSFKKGNWFLGFMCLAAIMAVVFFLLMI